ncbi:MAG: ComEC family competence protein [Planctomycetota bacterium]|nr:MAG: ComEC family competence protein [Planctomycetota bacterium]REJ87594.1 MAG: ComEC family competence protein [Planctomycetota bacterium]
MPSVVVRSGELPPMARRAGPSVSPFESNCRSVRRPTWRSAAAETAKTRSSGSPLSRILGSQERRPAPRFWYAAAMAMVAGHSERESATASAHQPLVVVLLVYCAGLVLDRFLVVPPSLAWTAAATLLVAWWIAWHRARSRRATACLLLAVFLSAAAWHHTQARLYGEADLARFARIESEPTCLRARATRAPERIPVAEATPLHAGPVFERSRLVIEVEAIRDRARWRPVTGNATLTVDGHLLGIRPGDRLQVFAQLSQPPPPLNPGQVDVRTYARRRRETTRLFASYPDCITRIEGSRSWSPRNVLARLRAAGEVELFENVGRGRSALAAAVLLGQRSGVPRDTSQAFVRTGTIHLLAISGLHIGILASALLLLLRVGWLPQRVVLPGIMLLTLGYALLADARPPVLRAAAIVVVFCFSLQLGRRSFRFNTLAAAGLIVLVLQPLELFSMGTQLSFLAVGTLVAAAPAFTRWQQQDALTRLIEASRPWPTQVGRWVGRWYWRVTLTGLVIWLVALPLVMYRVHIVSPSGVLVTPLLYLPLAGALLAGLSVLVTGWLAPPLASFFGAVCHASIAVLDTIVTATERLPGSYFWVAGPQPWWLIVFYAALIAWALLPHWRPPTRWCFALLGAWIAVGFMAPWFTRPDHQLRGTFLAVGHGCATVLEMPDDRVLLYDAGQLGSPGRAASTVASYLWSQGRTHIDAIVISHADVDHYNGVPQLLEQFSVGVVYISPAMQRAAQRPDVEPAVAELFRSLEAAGVLVRTIHAGDELAGGDVRIEVLHPTRHGVPAFRRDRVDNANSIVLAIEYAGRRILLPGDLESPGADDVMAEEPWDCDVLLAPHHGSARSNPPGFAAWCRPEWTVVSGRRGLDLSAVQAAYTTPGQSEGRLLHTSQHGAIRVIITANRSFGASEPSAAAGVGDGPPTHGDRGELQVDAWRGTSGSISPSAAP